MSRIYLLLNSGMTVEAVSMKRVWLDAGVPVTVGPGLTLCASFDVKDDSYIPVVTVQSPRARIDYPIPESSLLDISAWAGLKALPRAVEFSSAGRPLRLLVEFISTDSQARWSA